MTSDKDQPGAVAGKKPLFLNRSFALLWSGQTISLIGSHISAAGLQITAVLTMAALTPLFGLWFLLLPRHDFVSTIEPASSSL
ncbi:hypothetical protein [Dictyobacter arantiisoli]|uniref:MFS transporter n=1 Tax=Dictyobacter arantiisoli TaxID=2014874 RepID=A0A5A5T7R8_9CHLR|nr:hypothetical protein [Dictyobacter arantiisoli]GCF06999.1 hypothetical protein KDI_05630 [Dictyobacter arantiisoli]